MAEWLKAHAWKACIPQGIQGSNPCLSASRSGKHLDDLCPCLPIHYNAAHSRSVMDQYIERVVDLIDPQSNHLYNMSAEEAREILLRGPAEAARQIQGSFALLAKSGKAVRMARS